MNNNDQRVRINERIKISPVRVIKDGENLGILDVRTALNLAREAGLDLVEVSPHVRPPVCRILDYGKFQYEQKIKEKEQRKNSRSTQAKEAWLRPVTQDHDIDTKIKAIHKWLQEGHPVMVKIEYKAREITHKELGFDIMAEISDNVQNVGIARKPSLQGKILSCLIEPKKK